MEEDERREAAIASAASLQPNFTPKSNITPSQLSKFHELHTRRLHIKAKSKTKKKIKGVEGNGKSNEKETNGQEDVDEVSGSTRSQDSSIPFSKGSAGENFNSTLQESVAANPVSATKRQKKLYWGLDTKERWEMKANM